jgi:hypothetical protein
MQHARVLDLLGHNYTSTIVLHTVGVVHDSKRHHIVHDDAANHKPVDINVGCRDEHKCSSIDDDNCLDLIHEINYRDIVNSDAVVDDSKAGCRDAFKHKRQRHHKYRDDATNIVDA